MPRRARAAIAISLVFCLATSIAQASCLVAAHRGASGYRPEHTLEAYQLAIEQGADYIELDVVLTADGVPVVRHEPLLNETTDVGRRPEWAGRRSKREIAGRYLDDWFVDDFTLQEFRTLRAVERLPDLRPANARHDGLYPIPTLEQVIDLVASHSASAEKPVGLYIELKHPAYFRSRGLDITRAVVDVLARRGLRGSQDPVLLQSFDATALKEAARLTGLRRVQLVYSSDEQKLSGAGAAARLDAVAAYAQGLGVPKSAVKPLTAGAGLSKSSLVDSAHKAGLFLHVYTFRVENQFLGPAWRRGERSGAAGDLVGELNAYLDAGIDGFFIDYPDVGRSVCDARKVH